MKRRNLLIRAADLVALLAMPVAAVPPWQDQVIGLAQEIERILSESTPAGASIKGFQFKCFDGIDPATIW